MNLFWLPRSLLLGFAFAAGNASASESQASAAGADAVHAPLGEAGCRLDAVRRAVSHFSGELATTINSAAWFSGGATEDGAAATVVNPVLPAHCIITGVIDAHVGDPDGTQYGNNFRLRIPRAWNRRFFFQGGGGNNGSVGNAIGLLKDGQNALTQGYAVAAQDSGHAGSSPSFALDRKAYDNFAYKSVHDTTLIAKAIINSYAGRYPGYSYFVGCSNGGREAIVSAQRYEDFDGVVAGAPAMSAFDQWVQNIWVLQAVSTVAGTPPGAVPTDTSKAYTDAQLAYAGDYFQHKCDKLDGVEDGLMSNYRACTATPEDLRSLQCLAQGGASADPNCLGPKQIDGLRKVYSAPANKAAHLAIPGFFPGSIERLLRDTYLGKPGSDYPLGVLYKAIMPNMYFMGYGFLGYPNVTGTPNKVSSYPDSAVPYVAQFNFDNEPAKLAGRLDLQADNVDPAEPGPNFEKFKKRGGKMLIYTGTADPAVQASGVMAFVDSLAARYKPEGSSAMARLFPIPGMNHCRGGTTADQIDQLAPLVAWVERGEAPERIIARAAPNSELERAIPGITRPLCVYPRHAQYMGTGDKADAANFVCVDG